MGKIRIKTFDEASIEDEAKLKTKKESKKADKIAAKNALRASQGKKINPQSETPVDVKTEEKIEETKVAQDDRLVSEAIIPETTPAEVIANPELAEGEAISEKPAKDSKASEGKSASGRKTKKEKFVKQKTLSERVNSNRKLVSKNQTYPLEKAVTLLTQFKTGKFDESVELHVSTREQGVSGVLNLPHGSGKTLRIKIADDAILASIEAGKIDFDVLVATPDMMPKLAKVARILGPRGLMPNPKNGTVTPKPEDAVKKLSGGEIRFKTEPKAPIIHLIIGKMSFGEKKILENAKSALDAIGENKIKSATLTSTMSPGIKLQVSSI